jgi:diguanylate cyclase (GGDEF)-like protein/PAS domain S-box-containing protein
MLRASRTAEALRRSEAKLVKAQSTASLGYWELDVPSWEFTGSDELYRIVGNERESLGTTWQAFLHCVHPEDREPIHDLMDQILADHQPRSADFRVVRPDESERIVHQQAEVASSASNGVLRVEGTLQDITDLRRAEEQVRFLASYDPLTGLPNRTLILDRLSLLLQRTEGGDRGLALFLVGVDHFKRINDTLGHRAGDRLLQEIGERLVQCLLETDRDRSRGEWDRLVGRFAGDEFAAFVADGTRVEEVARLAARLTRALRLPFMLENQEVFVTTSIGIALFPFDGRDAESLLRNAASAMAHAKAQGLTDYQFYTESMNTTALNHFILESNLRKAVEHGEFTLHYQPQVDLHSGKIVGTEALIRWQSPELGMVFPLDFISLAEETGLIFPIGDWVFREACAQAKKWQGAGLTDLRMAVNVSAKQFGQKDFTGTVVRAFEGAGLDPRCLDTELTESTVMQDVDSAILSLTELKSMGLQVSVDDFGTGYSSLSYLQRFPLDALKIDYTFMIGLPEDPEHRAITSAIIALGKSLNLRVVAEGVESKEQLDFLREKGCDEAQGDFLCPALPAEEFQQFVQQTWNPSHWR